MKDELASVMQEIARLAAETAAAINRGDIEEAQRLQRETDTAWQRARKVGQRQSRRPSLRSPSVRERAISAVVELGVPSSPKLIAAYSEALTGDPFDVRALASIRRDEQRSWMSGSRRDAYLVPALEGPWFVAARGRFALSNWPLWQRIVGPLSPRADHLRVCESLCDRIENLGPQHPSSRRLRPLLVEYARTIPNALENAWESAESVSVTRVRAAAAAELNLIGVEDENWRKKEAERASRSLDEAQQIWGGSAPQVLGSKPA
jgi:hypothetical protein